MVNFNLYGFTIEFRRIVYLPGLLGEDVVSVFLKDDLALFVGKILVLFTIECQENALMTWVVV